MIHVAEMMSIQVLLASLTLVSVILRDINVLAVAGKYQVYIGSERYSPQQEDTYCSTMLPFNEATAFATRFTANASQHQVHHMILQACYGQPAPWYQPTQYVIDAEHGIYGGCGMASYSALSQACVGAQIMFAWARNAPPVQLPDDVSYPLGQHAGNTHLLLQVHYAQPAVGDTSGVLIDFMHAPTAKAAGVLLLGSSGGSGIPAHTESINMYMSCSFDGDVPIHPFAFRTHAHDLGRVIAGFIDQEKRGQPKLFARGDPRLPQFFYPLRDTSLTITPGDAIAAACNFNASSREHTTAVGATHNDEMCNLYIMYSYDMSAVDPAGGNDEEGGDVTGTSFRRKRRSIQRECFDDQLNYRRFLPDPATLKLSKAEQQALLDDAYGAGSGVTVDSVMGGSMMSGGMHHHHNHPPETGGMHNMQPPQQQQQNVMQTDMQHATGAVTKKAGVSSSNDVMNNMPHAPQPESAYHPLVSAPPLSSTNYSLVPDWFDYTQISSSGKIGQVAGLSFDPRSNRLFVFHRASHIWGSHTFDPFSNKYMEVRAGPIADAVVLEIDAETGRVIARWGENMFYMPHSVTVDHASNVWLTDVALHQVLKFSPNNRREPVLVLGEKFTPGSDKTHFCKPTDVAVLPTTGEFFVSDGYCNARVVKFAADGHYLTQIGVANNAGAASFLDQFIDHIPEPAAFSIPHTLALDRTGEHVFIADRENGRIQVFRTVGKLDFVKSLLLEPFMGSAVYAVDYRNDTLVAVNGKLQLSFMQKRADGQSAAIVGAVIDAASGAGGMPLAVFGAGVLKNPHCVAIGADLQDIYVGEIGPNRLSRFTVKNRVISSLPALVGTAKQPLPPVENENSMQHVISDNMDNMPGMSSHDDDKQNVNTGSVKHDDAVVLAGQQRPPSDGDRELLGSGMATLVTLMFCLVPLALVCMGLMYWKARREQASVDAALGDGGGAGRRSSRRMLGDPADDSEGDGEKLVHGGLSGVSVRASRAARRINERANGTSSLQQMLSKQKGFAPVPTSDESHDFRASDFDDEESDGDGEELFSRKKFGGAVQQAKNDVRT